MIQGMGNFKYPERLRQLELPTLAYRRNSGDMIVTYKLLSGLYDDQVALHLDMGTIGQHYTRGNSWKLTVIRCRFDSRKYCFTNRIVNMWNSLPDNVILANNVNSLKQFETRLDEFWSDQDIMFDLTAEITGTGDRSEFKLETVSESIV